MTARILPFVRRSDPSQHPERRSLTPAPPHIERKDDPDAPPRFTKFGPDFDRYLEEIRNSREADRLPPFGA